ncbi:hypothetical protein FQN57_003979 [Myotisia sp. PD_48]|nr:hypothetical protein FQN57_003979 [Myotisia sp. PD_48]
MSASKWKVGSLFQQAVAGVESRLDTILAEGDGERMQNVEKTEKVTEQPGLRPGMSLSMSPSPNISRSSSSARANDRLQERLARAMVKQSSSNNLGGSTSSNTPSRTSSPLPPEENRTSVDSSPGHIDPAAEETKSDRSSIPRVSHDVPTDSRASSEIIVDTPQKDLEVSSTNSKEQNGVVDRVDEETLVNTPQIDIQKSAASQMEGYEDAMAQLQAEHEASELRWQEELHNYVEKIDALQAKLKYLAKEAAESARNNTAAAATGSTEKKLFEKDERIAALLEEGQKLSKTELDHRTTIKKLRQYIAENSKSQADLKKKLDKVENDLSQVQDRAKRAEAAERSAATKLQEKSQLERELESVLTERDSLNSSLVELKTRLLRADTRAEAAERKAQASNTLAEKRQITELKDDLSSAKIEREISEEKLRREIRDLQERLDREKERSRAQEVELRGEQTILESKMETLRARAEEVSSSTTGDAQAKLLRQVETLQTQHAVASENWHGIESSILSQLANVEKERDDFAKREGDLRRKVREANLKAKRAEGELENSRALVQELERDLEESKREVERLNQRIETAEKEVLETKQQLSTQKEYLEATWTQRFEDEKAKWHEQQLASPPGLLQARTESITPSRRSDILLSLSDRPPSLRSASNRQRSDTPPRQSSYSSFNSNMVLRTNFNNHSAVSVDIPPIQTFEPDEYFADNVTPATPSAHGTHAQPPRAVNDVVSVSTVAAGPSVQLVERMSASVRRLESERAGLKDELIRLTAQRDEARQEVVELMKEVEEKRAADVKIQDLEATVQQLDERYQTALEMLGEKSEQTEELKADIEDLKKIMRELAEKTAK